MSAAPDYHNKRLYLQTNQVPEGQIAYRSPSNIALIKYWGKYGQQFPRNASLSFTLSKACTETEIHYRVQQDPGHRVELSFFLHGDRNSRFEEKTRQYIELLSAYSPFLKQLTLEVHSRNTFPHGTGIASSASGMSALALCICGLEKRLFGTLTDWAEFNQKASYFSRLGSGSACRSVYPVAALWGESPGIRLSSNEFALPWQSEVHAVFQDFHDDILIVSSREKKVSSRAGHALMEGNLYAPARYEQARMNLHRLLPAMKTGDLDTFIRITENEALTLHALMMTSEPSYVLMQANTLKMIDRIQDFRNESKVPVCFTLDAGPNIHLLYPEEHAETVAAWRDAELLPLCEDGRMIADAVGKGPEQLI